MSAIKVTVVKEVPSRMRGGKSGAFVLKGVVEATLEDGQIRRVGPLDEKEATSIYQSTKRAIVLRGWSKRVQINMRSGENTEKFLYIAPIEEA